TMAELFRDPNWRNGLMHSEPDDSSTGASDDMKARFDRLKENSKLYLLNKRQVMRDYTRYMDGCISVARQPYGLHTTYPAVPEDPVSSLLAGINENGQNIQIKGEMQTTQLLLALALRAYRLEHGRYPKSLKELVPSYLSKLPLDPMSGQVPFGFQVTGDS